MKKKLSQKASKAGWMIARVAQRADLVPILGDAPSMLGFADPVPLLGDAPSMLGFANPVPRV